MDFKLSFFKSYNIASLCFSGEYIYFVSHNTHYVSSSIFSVLHALRNKVIVKKNCTNYCAQ